MFYALLCVWLATLTLIAGLILGYAARCYCEQREKRCVRKGRMHPEKLSEELKDASLFDIDSAKSMLPVPDSARVLQTTISGEQDGGRYDELAEWGGRHGK